MLGASTWRIEEITHDKVMVSPAPGQPGKVPFWHGDLPVRAARDWARSIGALTARRCAAMPRAGVAASAWRRLHGLDPKAAAVNLLHLPGRPAAEATGAVARRSDAGHRAHARRAGRLAASA